MLAAVTIAAWALGPQRDRGAVVDLSMAEAVASVVAEYVTAQSLGDVAMSSDVLRGVYRSATGEWLAAEVHPDERALLTGTVADVVPAAAPADLDRALAGFVGTRPGPDALAALAGAGVRIAAVARGTDLLADAHLGHRNFFAEVAHPDPEIGSARLVGMPWRFAGEGALVLGPPPALGNWTLPATTTVTARPERLGSAAADRHRQPRRADYDDHTSGG